MPQGFSSAARNLFLLGATGQSLVSNFFRTLDQSSVSNTSSWEPKDIIHSESNEKYYIGGSAKNTSTNKDIGFIESRDWDDETDPQNPTTTQEWFVTKQSVDNTAINCMDQDAAGNLIVGGYFEVAGGEVPFFAKYSTAGVLDWQSSSYSGGVSYNSVCSDSNNTYYACGQQTPDSNGQAEAFVEKFDADGNPSWGKSCILVGREIKLLGIDANERGEVVAVGSIEDDSATKGFIIKINTITGEVLWDKTIRSYDKVFLSTVFSPVTCEDIYIDDNDQIYVVGRVGSGINGQRGFIIKYTAEGNVIWQKETATNSSTAARYYKVKADTETEQVVVYGQYYENGSNQDMGLLTKYNKAGNVVWRRTINPDTTSSFGPGPNDGSTLGMDSDPSNIYLLYTDSTSPNNFYTFGRVSSAGNGLGNFQYDDGQSNTVDYNTLAMEDQIGRLYDGSVSQNSSDLITYPFSANKIVFDDLATQVSNKKKQMDSAEGFNYSGSPAIRVADFQELNLLGNVYSGSGDWLDQSGKGNDGEITSGSVSKSIGQIVVTGKHPGSYNYGTGGAVTYDTYGTVNEDTTTTLPYSNSDWTHYGGKARDLGTGGFKVTLTNSAASNFFMACWVKFDTYQQSRQMGVDLFGNYVYWETLQNGKVGVRHNGGSRQDSANGTGIDDGNWHHIALSRDGSTLTGYVDGNIVVSTTSGVSGNSVPANAGFWFFGGSGTAYNFDGQILDPIINIGTGTSGGILVPTKPAIDSNGVFGEGGSGTGPFYSNSWEYASPAITLGSGTFNAEPFSGAGSIKFDGNDDHLNVTSTDLAFGTGDFTVECWVWFSSKDNSLDCIMESRSDTSLSDGILLGRFQTSGHEDKIELFTGGTYRITGDVTTPDNTWVHVAVVRQSGTTKLYVNGTASSSTYSDSNNYSNDDLIIGENAVGSYQLHGYISNFRMVKGTAVYTSNFTPPTSPLTNITNTKLLCCQFDDTQIINTGKMYKSDTLYTTKAEVVSNGTLVDNGEQFDTDSSPSAQGDDVYFYYVPSGNETNGDQIFSADPGFVNDNSGSNNHVTTWWSHNGSSWVWGSGTGGYGNDNYASEYQFLFGSDSNTYRLDQNIDFYGVGNNGASSPTKMGGTAPTLNQYGTDTLTSAVSPGTIEMNGGARTMVTTTGANSSPTYNTAGYWEFDGTDDYISLGTQSFINIDFSLEAWVNITASKEHYFFSLGYSDSDSALFFADVSTQELKGIIRESGVNSTHLATGEILSLNEWYHILWTRDGTSNKIYLNGEEVGSFTRSAVSLPACIYDIGWATTRNKASAFTQGKFGDVRIYPRALRAAQVFQNYNATKSKYINEAPVTAPTISDKAIVYDNNLLLNYDFGNRATYDRAHNILFGSEDWNHPGWVGYCGAAAKGYQGVDVNTTDVLTPFGDNTAIGISKQGTGCGNDNAWGIHWKQSTSGGGALVQSGETYTVSAYLRGKVGGETIDIGFDDGAETQHTLTTEWVRYTHTGTPSTGTSRGFQVKVPTGITNQGFYIWHPQVESGSSVGRYVPTYGTSITAPTTVNNLSSDTPGGLYTGTLNGPTFNTDGSFQFDGTDDDIETGLNWTPANQFSFTMWFNLDTIKEWHNLVDMFNTDSLRNFQLFVEGNGDYRIYWGNSSTGSFAITSPTTAANTWYFGAFTSDGENGTLYRYGNGTTDSVSATAPGGTYSVKPVVLGRRGDSSASGFVDGKIGEFQFYNTELSASEILQNYNATKGKYGV